MLSFVSPILCPDNLVWLQCSTIKHPLLCCVNCHRREISLVHGSSGLSETKRDTNHQPPRDTTSAIQRSGSDSWQSSCFHRGVVKFLVKVHPIYDDSGKVREEAVADYVKSLIIMFNFASEYPQVILTIIELNLYFSVIFFIHLQSFARHSVLLCSSAEQHLCNM